MNPLRSSENTEASPERRNDEHKTAKRAEAAVPGPFGVSLLETILAHMEQGVVVYDADLKLVVFNRRYTELLDIPLDVLKIGASYEEVLRFIVTREGMAAGEIDAYVAKRLVSAKDFTVNRQMERHLPNGKIIAIDRGPIPGGGFINTYTDITNRRKVNGEAVRNAELLRTTLENMADGVRVFDKDLRLVAWNTKSLQMLNYPLEMGKVGTQYSEFVDYSTRRGDYRNDGADGQDSRMKRAKKGKGRGSELVTPDGRIIQKQRNPMPDGGFVSTYQDVTALKHAQMMLQEAKERAEQASRSKSEFLANMSHELRTPLNAIIGFSQIMCDELLGTLGNETYREYARDIKDSGIHLLSIINDILDLSKVEAGKTQLNEENVDIGSVMRSCLHLMEERATAAKVTLTAELPDALPLVRCDERLMRQIILNLLSNAVKFTPAGGSITVSIAIAGGLKLTVVDTGIGISEEDLSKVKAPFVQVDNSLSRKFNGTGLGLPLVESFALLHGGSFALASKLGEGTSATVCLPAERIVR